MPKKILIFFLLILVAQCKTTAVAYLDATIATEGDTTGTQSAKARINFTEFSPKIDTNDAILLSFSNAEGDLLLLKLSPVEDSFPVNHSYDLDGNANTVEASVHVMLSGKQTVLELSSKDGFINLFSLDKTNDVVNYAGGEFSVNFTSGGSGSGIFSASSK